MAQFSFTRAKGEGAASTIGADPRAEPLYCSHERVIVIRGVHWNLNLRELHDSIYGEPRADDTVRFIFADGALILSQSPEQPALLTGTWPKTPALGGTA